MSEASSQYILKPGEKLQDFSYSKSVLYSPLFYRTVQYCTVHCTVLNYCPSSHDFDWTPSLGLPNSLFEGNCSRTKRSKINLSLKKNIFWKKKTFVLTFFALRTTVSVEEGFESLKNSNISGFSLGFSKTVNVKKTSMDRFNWNDFLNFLGSNLGLWPGLGLFQLFEWTVTFLVGTESVTKLSTFIKRRIL